MVSRLLAVVVFRVSKTERNTFDYRKDVKKEF